MLSIPEILERMGLNEKETAVYLALLSVGTAPASSLSKRTKLPKSTAHYTCQQLVKKGLARMVQKGASFYFTCEPPEKLLHLLEKKRKDIDSLQEHVTGILGPLKNMISVFTSLPNVQYHEGESGIIELLDDILKLEAPIDSFEDRGYVFESFPTYDREFNRKRVELKIPSRCITPAGSGLYVTDPKLLLTVRNLDGEKYPFTWQIRLCQDMVAFFSFEKKSPVGISIRHADITSNFHTLFDLVWDSLEDTSA